MDKDYKFGYNYEEDLKELYGKDADICNEKRLALYSSLDFHSFDIKHLGSIIQNPVPITKEQLEEWIEKQESAIMYLNKTLNDIGRFVRTYHLIK